MIFEETVVGAYDIGKLDDDLLSVLMEPYVGTDIDTDDARGLLSKDGLDVIEIVLKTFGAERPPKPYLPEDMSLWTAALGRANDQYWKKRNEAFRKITKKFGWW